MELVSVDETPSRRVDLAAAYRIASQDGFAEGICNHLTAKAEGAEDEFLVIPYGLHWSEVTPSSLLRVTTGGDVLEGAGDVEPTALHIHAAVHHERPDVTAVFHTHMPYATAMAALQDPRLLPISQNALRFHDRVAYEMHYSGAIDSEREGALLASSLREKDILFHAHHGVIVLGQSIAEAYDDLYYLERACQIQVFAMGTGARLNYIADSIASAYTARDHRDVLRLEAQAHFDARKRLLQASSRFDS